LATFLFAAKEDRQRSMLNECIGAMNEECARLSLFEGLLAKEMGEIGLLAAHAEEASRFAFPFASWRAVPALMTEAGFG
jgi:hypothetical protein